PGTRSPFCRDEGQEDSRVVRVPDHDLLVLRVVPELVSSADTSRRDRGTHLATRIEVNNLHGAVAVARPGEAALAFVVTNARGRMTAALVAVSTDDNDAIGSATVAAVCVRAGADLTTRAAAEAGEDGGAMADE